MFIVAGGAGYLGSHIIEELLRNNYSVLCLSSRKSSITDKNLLSIEVDLLDEKEISNSLSSISKGSSKVFEGIVNAAGRSKRKNDSEHSFSKSWDSLSDDASLDPKILWNLAKYMLLRNMNFCPNSNFVDIGSIWAHRIPYSPLYLDLGNEPDLSVVLGKSCKRTLVRFLAKDFGEKSFTINQVSPGWFPKPSGNPRPDYINGITNRIPLNRIGSPRDLLPVLITILTNRPSYSNGSEYIIDGGFDIY